MTAAASPTTSSTVSLNGGAVAEIVTRVHMGEVTGNLDRDLKQIAFRGVTGHGAHHCRAWSVMIGIVGR